jgi:RNA polymerase sigma-70 factor (ECF subfamily)
MDETDPPAAGGAETDRALALRATGGDRSALAALYDRHRERLLALVRARLGKGLRQRLDSDDIVQSALVDAVRDYSVEGRAEDEFFPWMARVVERTIRDRAKFFARKKRGEGAAAEAGGVLDERAGPASTPSEILAKREDVSRLEAAIARLNVRDRQLVRLAKVESRSTAEIADLLGKSTEATKKAVSRALARLAELLVEGGGRQ